MTGDESELLNETYYEWSSNNLWNLFPAKIWFFKIYLILFSFYFINFFIFFYFDFCYWTFSRQLILNFLIGLLINNGLYKYLEVMADKTICCYLVAVLNYPQMLKSHPTTQVISASLMNKNTAVSVFYYF